MSAIMLKKMRTKGKKREGETQLLKLSGPLEKKLSNNYCGLVILRYFPSHDFCQNRKILIFIILEAGV